MIRGKRRQKGGFGGNVGGQQTNTWRQPGAESESAQEEASGRGERGAGCSGGSAWGHAPSFLYRATASGEFSSLRVQNAYKVCGTLQRAICPSHRRAHISKWYCLHLMLLCIPPMQAAAYSRLKTFQIISSLILHDTSGNY